MFEIKGNIATAICYATVVEDEAIEQIRLMCDQEFTRDSKICIMPDVHTGKGCTIGTTMTVMDKVVPNVVGVDIGCGMYTVNIGQAPIDLVRLDEAAHYVPSGMRECGKVEKSVLICRTCGVIAPCEILRDWNAVWEPWAAVTILSRWIGLPAEPNTW